jgi:hypothetical protein
MGDGEGGHAGIGRRYAQGDVVDISWIDSVSCCIVMTVAFVVVSLD